MQVHDNQQDSAALAGFASDKKIQTAAGHVHSAASTMLAGVSALAAYTAHSSVGFGLLADEFAIPSEPPLKLVGTKTFDENVLELSKPEQAEFLRLQTGNVKTP